MKGYPLLVASIVFSALASLFLKLNAAGGDRKTALHSLFSLWSLSGMGCYTLAFVCYVFVLKRVPLSIAQPAITAGTSAITALFACLLFKEYLSPYNLLGLFLIFVGIFLLFLQTGP